MVGLSSEPGAHVKRVWRLSIAKMELRLTLRREENRRTWRKTLEARERPTLLTWVPSFFENQHEAIPRWSPIQLLPCLTGLNLEFSGERQHANLICHACSPSSKHCFIKQQWYHITTQAKDIEINLWALYLLALHRTSDRTWEEFINTLPKVVGFLQFPPTGKVDRVKVDKL